MVLKLERFSHISNQFFGLDSPIRLEYLSLVLSLRFDVVGKGYLEEGYPVP